MIFSSLKANDDSSKYPEAIRTALSYLSSHDFMKMEAGTFPISGKNIYAMLMDIKTKPVEEKRPESHKKYIDVQYIVKGKEMQGIAPDCGNETVVDCKEENDIYFYASVKNESFVIVDEGSYTIYFPNDIHRPGCSVSEPEDVRKVVIKVNVDLL